MVKTYEEQLENNLNFFKYQLENSGLTTKSGKPVRIDFNTVTGKVLYTLINAFTVACSNNDKNAEYLYKQFFVQTANYEALREFHGNTWGVSPIEYTQATGYVLFQGEEGASVTQNTQISSSGKTYSTQETGIITKKTIKIKTLTSINGIATAVMIQDLKISSGMTIRAIYGANQEQYNKQNIKITAISSDSFTYEVDSDTPQTATGNVFVDIVSVVVYAESNEKGEDQNLINGTELSMNVPKVGVNDTCYVCYDGITGGKNAETQEDYKERVLNRIRTIPQGWNIGNIEITIRAFQYYKYNNSLIFIPRAEKVSGDIQSGYTTIYMLKNDLTTLSVTEASDLKQYLVDTIYKINPTEEQVNVISPILKTVTIKLSLKNDANTLDMKEAVENTIKDMQNDSGLCYFRKNIIRRQIEYYFDNIIDSNGILLEDNYDLILPDEDNYKEIHLQYNEFPILKLTWND